MVKGKTIVNNCIEIVVVINDDNCRCKSCLLWEGTNTTWKIKMKN